jgi:hypothetical protein
MGFASGVLTPSAALPSARARGCFCAQMISLMDRLLKRENLDLRMTPYKVVCTTPRSSSHAARRVPHMHAQDPRSPAHAWRSSRPTHTRGNGTRHAHTHMQVLPTSADDGLVEFVPSTPLSVVLAEHRTIHRYLALTQVWHASLAS